MTTSFPSPERVSLARSTGRSVFRSQTAGRSTSQHGTRSHPHIQAGIGSQSSIQFNTVVRRTPLIDDNGLRARLRVVSSLRLPCPLFSRQGTKGRDRWKVYVPVVPPAFSSEGVPKKREVTMLGPKNPSRWLPHQGKRECTRRLIQSKEEGK